MNQELPAVRSLSFRDATALAKSGDAEAQYALSAVLSERGRFDESMSWLRMAAAQRLIPAQITLAMCLMDGIHCQRDRQQAIDLLQPLAATDIQANLLLSELHGFAAAGVGDRNAGLRFLLNAARMGAADALRQLALLCVCHQRWDLVRPLLSESARRGDAAASYALARCYSEGIGGAPDPALAFEIARSDAARSQYLFARREHHPSHHAAAGVATMPTSTIDWAVVEQAIPHLASDFRVPSPKILNETPLIRRFSNVVHPLLLETLINLAAPLVARSQIVDARTGEMRADPMRNSWHVTLSPRQHDHVLEAVENCMSRVSGVPALNGEFTQILRYRVGEEFKPHVDYFNESGAGTYQSLADGGQRAQTLLAYLNDDYRGGSTYFPLLKLNVVGRPGDFLHFHNLGANGFGHQQTLHAGMPVTEGEKWLLSKWIRSEPYPPRIRW